MTLGVVCDGTAEALALQRLVQRLQGQVRILQPVYADMQSLAPAAQIVRAAEPKIRLLRQRGATQFLVLLDREDQARCPGDLSVAVATAFSHAGWTVDVIYKDRALENWLIADPVGIQRAIPKIEFSERIVRRIENSGADSISAHTLLNDSVRGGYSKRRDAINICAVLDPAVAKRNSRSFRKFTKCCGC